MRMSLRGRTNERDFPVPKVRRKPEAEMIEF